MSSHRSPVRGCSPCHRQLFQDRRRAWNSSTAAPQRGYASTLLSSGPNGRHLADALPRDPPADGDHGVSRSMATSSWPLHVTLAQPSTVSAAEARAGEAPCTSPRVPLPTQVPTASSFRL